MTPIIIRQSSPDDLVAAARVEAADKQKRIDYARAHAYNVGKVSITVLEVMRGLVKHHPRGFECNYPGGVEYSALMEYLAQAFGEAWARGYGDDAVSALLDTGDLSEPVLGILVLEGASEHLDDEERSAVIAETREYRGL